MNALLTDAATTARLKPQKPRSRPGRLTRPERLTSIRRPLNGNRTVIVPSLRFAPGAWAKLLYWRDAGPTEIGGFGISQLIDPLCVDDIGLVRQTCTAMSVQFDDAAVADWFEEQVDLGRQPAAFARIWIHTHPGNSPWPSSIDEETFDRVFGNCDWAVMFILARGGDVYARLRLRIGADGPGVALRLPVRIDWSRPLMSTDPDDWQAEYAACIQEPVWPEFLDQPPEFPVNGWALPDDGLVGMLEEGR